MKINLSKQQAMFIISVVLIISVVSLFMAIVFAFNHKGSKTTINSGGESFTMKIPEPITSESSTTAATSTASSSGVAVAEKVFPRIVGLSLGSDDVPVITVSVLDYGAVPNDNNDDTDAIKAAIAATSSKYYGGTVYLPAGKYIVKNSIKVAKNVRIRGEWKSPEDGSLDKGTVIYAYYGKNLPTAPALFSLDEAATVSNLTIYYPEQNINAVTPYAPTLGNAGNLGSNYCNITLINSYFGVSVVGHNAFYINNLYGTCLSKGIYINGIYDIPRLDNINFSAKYWAMFDKSVNQQTVETYTKNSFTALDLLRIDWLYLINCNIDGANTGIKFEASDKGASNGQFTSLNINNSKIGLDVTNVAAIGHQMANCSINVTGSDSIAVKAGGKFNGTQNMMFNNCSFSSEGKIADNATSGVLVFSNCTFKKWAQTQYAVNIGAGGVVLDSCDFQSEGKNINLANGKDVIVDAALILNNKFVGSPTITNTLNNKVSVIDNTEKTSAIAKLALPKITPPAKRKVAKSVLYNAKDYGLVNDIAVDNTAAIQKALNAAGKNGGGVVYIETGRYTVNSNLVIPSGVELRGVNDYWKHFGVTTKGTVLETNYGKDKLYGNPFIALSANSGVSGLSVFYPDQNFENNVVYSPTYQGMGDGCWLYNVNAPNAYNEVVMTCSDFHINYVRGIGLNVGLTVEGSNSGFVENLMLSGGDWQDGRREKNAPPADLWKKFPNYPKSTAIRINNSKNLTFYEGFVFGLGTGMELVGKVEGLVSLGTGVDASQNAIVLKNSGTNNIFVNSELVANGNYLDARKEFSGAANFYNTNCWMNVNGSVSIDGTGKIDLQVFKQATGQTNITGSTVNIQNAYLDSKTAKVIIGKDVKGGSFYNSLMGSLTLDYENNSGGKFVVNNIFVK